MHWNGDWHMGGMWIGWLLVIIVLGAALWFFWNATQGGGGSRRGGSPEDTLKRRYASGEIDEDTYEHMLEELRR